MEPLAETGRQFLATVALVALTFGAGSLWGLLLCCGVSILRTTWTSLRLALVGLAGLIHLSPPALPFREGLPMPNFCGECGESVGADQKFCSSCGETLKRDQPAPKVEEPEPKTPQNLKSDPRYKCPKCGGKSFYMGWKPASVQTGILDTDTQARFCGSCDVQMTWTQEGIKENRKLGCFFVVFVVVGSVIGWVILQNLLVLP